MVFHVLLWATTEWVIKSQCLLDNRGWDQPRCCMTDNYTAPYWGFVRLPILSWWSYSRPLRSSFVCNGRIILPRELLRFSSSCADINRMVETSRPLAGLPEAVSSAVLLNVRRDREMDLLVAFISVWGASSATRKAMSVGPMPWQYCISK